VELVPEFGRWTANVTDDARESTFLIQQLSVALQRRDAVSFQYAFTASYLVAIRCFTFLMS